MNKMMVIFCVAFCMMHYGLADLSKRSLAQITVRVLDDNYIPVTNAVVGVSTFLKSVPGDNFGRDLSSTVKVRTDTNGIAQITIKSLDGKISFSVRPLNGFYANKGATFIFTNVCSDKWQPWNPNVTLVMNRVVMPIPLYAKCIGALKPKVIPFFNKSIGFDLKRGDWVAPYGEGNISDFIFCIERELYGKNDDGYQLFDAKLTVSFSNPDDGIMPVYVPVPVHSALRMPRFAPESGYQTNLVRKVARTKDGLYVERRDDQNYFFRLRAQRDNAGNITNALYGKIHGEIEFEWDGRIRFTYYLNPTPNDRNLEFDPKRNLFTNLDSLEQVTEP